MTQPTISELPSVAETLAKKPSRRARAQHAALTVAAGLVATAFILPAAWILIGSFRPNQELLSSLSQFSWRLIIPEQLTFDNYITLLSDKGFSSALLNSFVVCLASVLFGLAVSSLAAYALSVFVFPGRNLIFAVVVISFMVPFEAIAVPLAQIFTDAGLANTLVALVLPGIGNGLAIFNLRQHFLGIPSSFREAAMLDGASEPRILWSVYLPMSGAALTNSALLIFLAQWSAYLWPLIIVSDENLQMAPVALASTFGEHVADYGQNFAGAVLLALVPAIAIFVLQRFFGRLSISSGEK